MVKVIVIYISKPHTLTGGIWGRTLITGVKYSTVHWSTKEFIIKCDWGIKPS